MISIRRFGYVVLLAASILNYAPSLASAEEPAHGRFTLTHEVRWENVSVPAGEYEFSYDPASISSVLTINKVSGPRAAFMLMVPMREESKSNDSNLLVLESTPDGSYVSALKLPESGVTLRFPVPHVAEKQMAKAVTTAPTGQ